MEKELLVLAEKLDIPVTIEVIGSTIIIRSSGYDNPLWDTFIRGIIFHDDSKIARPYVRVIVTETSNIKEIYANI